MTPNQEIEEMKQEIVQLKAILHPRTRSNKAIGDEGESIVAEMIQQFYPSASVQSTAREGSSGDIRVEIQHKGNIVPLLIEVKKHACSVARDRVDDFLSVVNLQADTGAILSHV